MPDLTYSALVTFHLRTLSQTEYTAELEGAWEFTVGNLDGLASSIPVGRSGSTNIHIDTECFIAFGLGSSALIWQLGPRRSRGAVGDLSARGLPERG